MRGSWKSKGGRPRQASPTGKLRRLSCHRVGQAVLPCPVIDCDVLCVAWSRVARSRNLKIEYSSFKFQFLIAEGQAGSAISGLRRTIKYDKTTAVCTVRVYDHSLGKEDHDGS